MSDMSSGPTNTQQFFRLQHDFASIIVRIRKSTQIWIGLIHGVAVGAGFALALACDLRIGLNLSLFSLDFSLFDFFYLL